MKVLYRLASIGVCRSVHCISQVHLTYTHKGCNKFNDKLMIRTANKCKLLYPSLIWSANFFCCFTALLEGICATLNSLIRAHIYTISSAGNHWKISARLIIQIFDRLIDYNRLLLMLICPLNSFQYMDDFP